MTSTLADTLGRGWLNCCNVAGRVTPRTPWSCLAPVHCAAIGRLPERPGLNGGASRSGDTCTKLAVHDDGAFRRQHAWQPAFGVRTGRGPQRARQRVAPPAGGIARDSRMEGLSGPPASELER